MEENKSLLLFQVSPAEIESILMKHDSVKDAAVIGVPDDISGEIPTAFVVRKSESNISAKELIDYTAGKCMEKFLFGFQSTSTICTSVCLLYSS